MLNMSDVSQGLPVNTVCRTTKEILRYLMSKPCRATQAWRCRAAHKSWYRSASGQMSGCTREVDHRQSVRSSIITEYFTVW